MKLKLNRPDTICWMLIPVIIMSGIVAGDQALDIYLHDTYYVIGYPQITIITLVMTLIAGLMYRFFIYRNVAGNMKLIGLHIIVSAAALLLLILIAVTTGGLANGRSFSIGLPYSYFLLLAIIAGLITTVIGVVLIIINLILSLRNT